MMFAYVFRRLCYYFSILTAIIIISFALFHIIPSDPARNILGPNADEDQVHQLRKKLGLDQPVHIQLLRYIKNVTKFDFGTSHIDDRNIGEEIIYRLKITLSLTGLGLLIIFLYLSIILSILNTKIRFLFDGVNFFISSLPIFFSGILAAIITIHYYPVSSFSGTFSVDDLLYLIPPAFVLSLYPMAILSGILKQEFSDHWNAPYIMAGKAFGFSSTTLLYKYFFKNAVIPILSALSSILPIYITGTFIVEIIFSIPGISSLIVKSVMEQDFPMLEASIIVNGLFFVLLNLGVEFLYPTIDPRVLKED